MSTECYNYGMYIVFDLEWNQSAIGKEGTVPGLPFEIIEIGAVKLNEKFEKVDEFHRIIKPVVYPKLHFRVLEVVDIGLDELQQEGEYFADAARDFLEFCGERPVFCTWGEADLPQLQRNMAYHGVDFPFSYPLLYYDVQKLYGLLTEGQHKVVQPLDQAVEDLDIEMDSGFHRALDDANYTAEVLRNMDFDKVKAYVSVDYYLLPENEEQQIYLIFPDYRKFVSRTFLTKEDAMRNKSVTDIMCPKCNRMLKKYVKWFPINQRQYLALGSCPEHGFVKGKIRIKHTDEGSLFAVKTIKEISKEDAAVIVARKREVTRLRAAKRQRKI